MSLFQNSSSLPHITTMNIISSCFNKDTKIQSLVRDGNFSSAIRLLNSSPIAPMNDETIDSLKEKHPEGPSTPFSLTTTIPISFSDSVVLKCLRYRPEYKRE